jgi:hypothetical protein
MMCTMPWVQQQFLDGTMRQHVLVCRRALGFCDVSGLLWACRKHARWRLAGDELLTRCEIPCCFIDDDDDVLLLLLLHATHPDSRESMKPKIMHVVVNPVCLLQGWEHRTFVGSEMAASWITSVEEECHGVAFEECSLLLMRNSLGRNSCALLKVQVGRTSPRLPPCRSIGPSVPVVSSS